MDNDKIISVAYDACIEAALLAAEEIIPFWPNPQNSRFDRQRALNVIEKEGVGNYATVADLASEKKIIEVLRSKPLLSNHSFLSEETEPIEADEQWRWVIDPIDGTPNFRNGNPDFGMCIALFNGQQPVLGFIAMPALRQFVIAKKGEDAKLLTYDGKELANLRERVSAYNDSLDMALIGYDLGYSNRRAQLEKIAEKVIEHVGYASVLASFSTGTFRLLQGMMGLYFGMSPTVMDIAPVATLIPAVGGVVTDMDGKAIDWLASERSYVGAINPQIHQQFLEVLHR